MKLRAYLALGLLCLGFPLCDLFQRLLLAPWIRIRPSRRIPAMGRWIQTMRRFVLWCVSRVGGASIRLPPRVVPVRPGTLIVMNHQSVLDIPLAVSTVVEGGYPRIVTRARYRRYVPLISHMVRLYQYPVVDPTANPRDVLRSIESLGREGAESDVPIAIFPEGTRTRDGSVGRFRTRGLRALLEKRTWTVYLFAVDGYWQTARFKDFMSGMGHIDGRASYLGTMEWTDPAADPRPFVEAMHARVVEGVEALRAPDLSGDPPS